MSTVYVIIASRGEYSDREEWPVLVVHSEERAKELVEALDAKARQEYQEAHAGWEAFKAECKKRGLNPYYPGPQVWELKERTGAAHPGGQATHRHERCEMEEAKAKSAEVA